MKYVHEFTIDRAKWLCGTADALYRAFDWTETQLCDSEDRKCCLGFYLESCGVAKKRLVGIANPDELPRLPKQAQWLVTETDPAPAMVDRHNSDACGQLIKANDSGGLRADPKRREAKIKTLFADQRIKVTFKGKYPIVAK